MKKNVATKSELKAAESGDEETMPKQKKVVIEDFDRNLIGTEFVNSDDDDGRGDVSEGGNYDY